MKASDDLFLGIHKFCTFWKFGEVRYFSSYDMDFLGSILQLLRFRLSFFLKFGTSALTIWFSISILVIVSILLFF
ncbi:hypothetical protein RclHR1_00060017 [Rhizophagus clarus]|uniref:Uncharacterized protein n=1 Tax=Rhizophagus clarus TaxID=94130 RepID=A0A2Z6RQR6_9GLOM|nr:hypothetical protein RclHR1_00060017 [Rhizophagus clarus]